ncbi:MAG TPA: DUF5682 family protein [Kofleriaceae bacterium]|nr:DUF5682 family protein [Kofleriaceae bacterium]
MFGDRVHLFPVRHHSPRASAVLVRLLERVRPARVLVEGPEDAGGVIGVLVDPETRPPVAILAYRTDGTPGSSVWPFASYSPEYVALRWAREHGVPCAFIDVASGCGLARERDDEPVDDGDAPDIESDEAVPFELAAAEAVGHRSFEEMWEAFYEAPGHDVESFSAALLAYAETVRAGADRDWHRARDTHMARRIREHAAEEEGPIAVVIGAAHAAAFLAGDVDDSLEVPDPVPTAVTVIPYSYPRLAEQTGYGAGNRAPLYYQRAHEAGADYRRATLEVLVDFTDRLRLRGFAVSLADTIEAYRLANMLAMLRGKTQPGLDEVREASIATLCRGQGEYMDDFLWPSVVGHGVGQVAARIGRNSLQEEFWRQVRARRLPETDALESLSLVLANEVEIGTSTFLHRLRVAGVPYATHRSTQRGSDQPGGIGALTRVREGWEAQWTPATDIALVEAIIQGETIAEVAARTLARQLAAARTTGEVADVLAEAVLTRSAEVVAAALAECDARASGDDDLPSLARACRALSYLVSYGSAHGHIGFAIEEVPPLCRKTFGRAVLRIAPACRTDDASMDEVADALRNLHEIAMSQEAVDRAAWFEAGEALVADYTANPRASGLACGLLYLAQQVGEERVSQVVGQRLSNLAEPAAAAGFLAGFLEVNALVLVKSRPVVQALDAFLLGLPADRFRDVLPVLRRALGPLGPTERRYLIEQIVALRGLAAGGGAREAAQILAERDREVLAEMNEELGKAMDDLDDLL